MKSVWGLSIYQFLVMNEFYVSEPLAAWHFHGSFEMPKDRPNEGGARQ